MHKVASARERNVLSLADMGVGSNRRNLMLKRILLLASAMAVVTALAPAQQPEVKHVPVKPTSAASGEQMFNSYCAACHGKDGKGGGPAAAALKTAPADLTALAQKNGGKYPSNHVSAAIQGDASIPAHGSKDMPIWGRVFWNMSQGHASEVQLRTTNLNKYIESLQQK